MSETKKLLVINSSARQTRSMTRKLTDLFVSTLTEQTAADVVYQDVGMQPPSFINEAWIGAAFTDPKQRTSEQTAVLAESDALVAQIAAADIIVIGAPMYNYSMPASLKAWFDLIARVGVTFSFDLSRGDKPIEPILHGKQLVVLSSRGEFDFAPGESRSDLNGLDPALKACAHYLGASADTMHSLNVEYEEFQDQRWQASVDNAVEKTSQLALKLAQ